jgi:Ca2+-binding EF-hand superfamily protein
MKKRKTENNEKMLQAIYNFRLSKEQTNDLETSFNIFDKDGTGNIETKDLKVILRALGFEPQEDEIKRLLSKINRSEEEEENNTKAYSNNTIDFNEFLKIMESKLSESEEIKDLKVGFYNFVDNDLSEKDTFITLESLQKIAEELKEEVSIEELKEMMMLANPDIKSQVNE